MSEKKGFIRKGQAPTVEELEKTVEQLNAETTAKSKTNENGKPYSYSIKLDEALGKRVEEATQKHRYTKKAFFLLAIEKLLEQLGH
jgi:preprotein translocase subunit SecD